MPYIVRTSVVGDKKKVEFLPFGPAEIGRRERYSGEELRIGIMKDQELAAAASAGGAGVTEEAILDTQDVAQMRREKEKLWGALSEHYQHFGKIR